MENLTQLYRNLIRIEIIKKEAVENQMYDYAAFLLQEEKTIKEKINLQFKRPNAFECEILLDTNY